MLAVPLKTSALAPSEVSSSIIDICVLILVFKYFYFGLFLPIEVSINNPNLRRVHCFNFHIKV